MSDNVVYKCGHCDGEGVCKRSPYGEGYVRSCSTCLSKDGYRSMASRVVKCSVCGGTGRIVQKVS